jgi:DNA-binding MarR family transcriptional regulator
MTKTDELYNTLRRLNRQMHRAAHREGCGGYGLYHGQESLLRLILQNDGASQRDLAEQLDVRPSSMTEMLTKLEQSGLITRKQDENDQRVMRIWLTDMGKAAAERIGEGKGAFTKSFFNGLSEEEQEQLLMLTNKLCAGLEAAEDAHESDRHEHRAGCHHHHGCENGMREHGPHGRRHHHGYYYECE